MVVLGVGAVVVDRALQPVVVANPFLDDLEPTPSGSPDPALAVEPFIVQVESMENAPLQEGVPLEEYLNGEETIADATYLGTNGPRFAVGALTATGHVCLIVSAVDPAASATPMTTICSNFSAFLENGITWNDSSGDVTWLPTGGVVWEGLGGP
jgi:hypothetical protein